MKRKVAALLGATALSLSSAAHATSAFAMTTSAINGTEKSSADKLESGLATLMYPGPKAPR